MGFGQRHTDFGLSIAEATVLYKVLFPIWAPLEFMYIVRLYKKKWGVMDILPTPQSIEEYTESYSQASDIEVLSLTTESDEDTSDTDSRDDDDDGNNGSGPSGPGSMNRLSGSGN